MAKTLTAIQTLVRFNARDDSLDLTVDPGLSITNAIYREVAAAFPWPELRKTVNLTAATTTSSKFVSWANATSAVFTDVKGVEVETTATSSVFNLLNVPDTEWDWNLAGKATAGIPVYYKRVDNSGTQSVELRPQPSYATGVVRVIGIIEPTELTIGASTTLFLASTADDALAYMIAASFAVRDGFNDLVNINVQKATSALKQLFSKEQITQETVKQIVGA